MVKQRLFINVAAIHYSKSTVLSDGGAGCSLTFVPGRAIDSTKGILVDEGLGSSGLVHI